MKLGTRLLAAATVAAATVAVPATLAATPASAATTPLCIHIYVAAGSSQIINLAIVVPTLTIINGSCPVS